MSTISAFDAATVVGLADALLESVSCRFFSRTAPLVGSAWDTGTAFAASAAIHDANPGSVGECVRTLSALDCAVWVSGISGPDLMALRGHGGGAAPPT